MGQDSENEELRDLLETLRSRIASVLAARGIPPQDADDLVQDVCIQFLHKRRGIEKPGPWFLGALQHECRMYWRSRSRRRTTAMDEAVLDTFVRPGGPPEQELRVLRRNLSRWISELDYRCRKLLKLRFKLGYEASEMAEETGYQRSSIDKVTRRCLDKLARKLAAALPPAKSP